MPSARLSCTDFSFPLLPHADALSLIAMLGLEGVDIGVFAAEAHTRPRDITPDPRRAARRIRSRLGRAGLEVADVYLIPGPVDELAANHPDARVRRRGRDVFLRVLEYAWRCGSAHMTGLPGVPWAGERRLDTLARTAAELQWRAETAADAGVVFSVEPHIGSVVQTPAQVQRLLSMTPGLTLTLDYSHFVARGHADRDVEPLLAHASHFHARGAARGRRQAPMKDNAIDYRRVLRAMKRLEYRGGIAFEFEYHDVDPGNELDVLSETILLRDLIRGRRPGR